jgi:hypothetical protein
MQLPQLCVARRHSFNAPQHETVLTSLRSLHKVMASTHAIATNTAFASAPGRANGITIAGPSAFHCVYYGGGGRNRLMSLLPKIRFRKHQNLLFVLDDQNSRHFHNCAKLRALFRGVIGVE